MSDSSNNIVDKADDVNKKFEQFRNVSPFPGVQKPYQPDEECDDVDVYHQPEATKSWKEADLKAFMYKVFKKNYRLCCENQSAQNWNIIDLKAKTILPVVQSKQILGITWEICDYAVSVGANGIKKGKPRYIEISFKDAISCRSLNEVVCKITSSYAHPALSVFVDENEDGEKVQFFNTRRPLAFERLYGQECDKNSKEYQIALKIKELLYSRFSGESNPQACSDYYMAWVMGIVKDPVNRCRTNILIADNDIGGNGKTTFTLDLPQLLIGYEHCVYSDLSDSNFAGGYEDKILVNFSEVTEADERLIDKIKKLVDEAVCVVEKKGKDKTTIPCFLRVTATTNHPEKFKMTAQDDRRWTVFFFIDKITSEQQKLVDIIKGCAWDKNKAARECPDIDRDQLRLCLYSVFEDAIKGKNIDISKPLQTDAKAQLVSGGWARRPLVKWALAYFTGATVCEPTYIRGSIERDPCPFQKTHLFAMLAKKKSDDSKTSFDPKTIETTLTRSGLFELEKDSHSKQTMVFLSDLGWKHLSVDDREAYTSLLQQPCWRFDAIKKRAIVCKAFLQDEQQSDNLFE